MKILISTFWTYPHTGGINTYMNILKSELEKAGHEVDIFAHHPSFEYYYLLGKQEQRIEKKPIWQPIFTYIQHCYSQLFSEIDPWVVEMESEKYAFEAACSTLNLDEYTIIHVQDVISSAALYRIKPQHVPLISTIHGWFTNEYNIDHPNYGEGTLTWMYNQFIEYCGVTNSQFTLLPSNWLKNIYVKDMNISPVQLVHVPYGIEGDHVNTDQDSDPLELHSPELKVISCIARLVPVKGHKYMFEALSLLKKDRSDWICYIIGDGPLRDELECLGKSLGIEGHLCFVGAKNNVNHWLQHSDIVILPSIQDNQPFVVMEAQLSGRPIIVTDAGGMPEMVEHEKTGLIARQASAESIYSNINKLIDNKKLRIRIGNLGKKWAVERWSVANMLSKVNAIYEQVTLNNRKGDPMKARTKQEELKSIKSIYPSLNESLFTDKDMETWKEVIIHLPEGYTVPDPNIVKLIQKSTK